jgi:hypothetical protein
MTGGVIPSLTDERCGATKESVVTSGDNYTLGLSLFPGPLWKPRKNRYVVRVKPDSREALVPLLRYREGLVSERSLVDRHVDCFDKTAVRCRERSHQFRTQPYPQERAWMILSQPIHIVLDFVLGTRNWTSRHHCSRPEEEVFED